MTAETHDVLGGEGAAGAPAGATVPDRRPGGRAAGHEHRTGRAATGAPSLAPHARGTAEERVEPADRTTDRHRVAHGGGEGAPTRHP